MGAKFFGYTLIFLISLFSIWAIPVPDYTLYGSATVNGRILTKEDSNIITLALDGKQLVSFKMGDVAADAYVLRVPMNSERTEQYAMAGDSVRIYIDGNEVKESPVTIGEFGTTVKLDMTIASESEQPTTPKSSGGGSSSHKQSTSDETEPKTTETVTIPSSQQSEEKTVVQPLQPKAEIPQTQSEALEQTTEKEESSGVSIFQRIKDFLGLGKITGAATTDIKKTETPAAKPLVGIFIALIIVAVGLAIAYALIFKKEGY